MIYPAMTYIGSNHFSALYGQNDTIIDQKATGLQHLYIDNYEHDLIHTACSTVMVEDTIFYADRIKSKVGHSKRHKSSKSYTLDHSIMVDEFVYDDFKKIDFVGAHEKYIRFKTIVTNTCELAKTFQFSSLLITTPGSKAKCHLNSNAFSFDIEGKNIGVITKESDTAHVSLDSPSGFMYRGIEDLLFDNNAFKEHYIESNIPISSSLSKTKILNPKESYTFEWIILIGDTKFNVLKECKEFKFVDKFKDIKEYWNKYLENINMPIVYEEEIRTKLVALKGALLDGLLPADLTGHYFANGEVSYYSRDALMGSRAFLYAGLYKDFESIVEFFLKCEIKANGEYYQRYRFDKKANEGANNNVFTQIDFIGYFTRIVSDYYHLTNKMICSFTVLDRMINVLFQTNSKAGLFGPEGGVNEGVYGPAFITSTNMFIVGGLRGAIALAKEHNQTVLEDKWKNICDKLFLAIENVFSSDKYYLYGYVSYHNQIINRYDTPQLLSGSLGYPITDKYKESFYTLLKYATYFNYGLGYSEQEYHDGPWIFNTAAAAEVTYLIGDLETYNHFMNWLVKHQNGFGMNPEAVDAKNENIPFINPLMWANSEFVCASYANIIMELRKKS